MNRSMFRALLLMTASVLLAAPAAIAQDDIRSERVRFERGASSAVVEGSITGYEIVDYVLGAREGQHMNVSMATDNGASYFNILAPGESDVAMFNGSMAENQYEGVLPESGDYRMRVYMMRSAARRNEVANYRLEMIITGGGDEPQPRRSGGESADVPASPEDGGPRNWEVTGVSGALNLREQPSADAPAIGSYAPGTILHNLGCQRAEDRIWCDVQELSGGPVGYVAAEFLTPAVAPDGSVATGPDDSASRAGQGDFDATGRIPCAQYAGQPMTECEFGVARAGGGYATVVITKPDGNTRAIYFMLGTATGADTSQADGYPEVSASREADLTTVRVGDERYEIPDAVIYGG